MAYNIQIRRDLATEWTTVNPILADGEFGYENDIGGIKIGDGITEWNSLPYIIDGNFYSGERIEYTTNGSYVIPANYVLEKIIVIPVSSINFKLGNTAGADDIVPEVPVDTDGTTMVLNIFASVNKTVYISGITANTSIVYFKRFVKPFGS